MDDFGMQSVVHELNAYDGSDADAYLSTQTRLMRLLTLKLQIASQLLANIDFAADPDAADHLVHMTRSLTASFKSIEATLTGSDPS